MRALPHSVAGLLDELEADYPPRCKSTDETLEDHMLYAGKVDLTATLRSRWDAVERKHKKELPSVLTK